MVKQDEVDEDDSDDDALGDESSSKSADTFEEQFRWLEEEVATLVADVHDLALYSKLNLTGFMKILKVCSTVPRVLSPVPQLMMIHNSSQRSLTLETRCKCI